MIHLHLNENLFLYDSPTVSAIQKETKYMHIYPDMNYRSLKQKLGDWIGIHSDRIVVGNGSSEIIQRLYIGTLQGNGKVIFPWPSYILYSELESLSGLAACRVPLTAQFKVDLQGIIERIDEETKLIILCNPNNPTGTAFKKCELDEFLAKIPERITVLVDEAYIDFVSDISAHSALELIEKYENLIVLRTLSKLYGLAALRLGYAVCSSKNALWLQSNLPNWNINRFVEAALDSCISNTCYFNDVKKLVSAEREWISNQLAGIGLKVVPSMTNYIYVYGNDMLALHRVLAENGILVRSLSDEALRITIGRRSENELLIQAAKEYSMR